LEGLLSGVSHEVDFPENANVKPPRGILSIPLGAKEKSLAKGAISYRHIQNFP
jgi:hypothetical protein